jgi:hypothetical protein
MEENKRLCPKSEEAFNQKAPPVIEADYIWKGSLPKASHCQVFCATLCILTVATSGGRLIEGTPTGESPMTRS